MPIRFVIADEKGKAWKLELEATSLIGKPIGDTINGKEIKSELDGYELLITGGSDSAGFPLSKDIEGIGLKKVLLKKGFGMKDNYPGIRRRKTLRGKQISETTSQINLKILKEGGKKLEEIFAEQNKPKEKKGKEVKQEEQKPVQTA